VADRRLRQAGAAVVLAELAPQTRWHGVKAAVRLLGDKETLFGS
jgi:hypothetical protein